MLRRAIDYGSDQSVTEEVLDVYFSVLSNSRVALGNQL